jgi:hypothetical protein
MYRRVLYIGGCSPKYMSRQTNSPTITFSKRVGTPQLKSEISATIERVIALVCPEVDLSHRTLNIVLTRANTGGTHGNLATRYSLKDRSQVLSEMDMMVNIGKDSPHASLVHETIHYLQMQLGALSFVHIGGKQTAYIFHYATAALINARVHNGEVLNMMTEGRTWRIGNAPTLQEARDDADSYRVMSPDKGNLNTDYSFNRYLMLSHEAQAHRLAFIIAKKFNFTGYDLTHAHEGAMRQMRAMNRPQPRTVWTVVHA